MFNTTDDGIVSSFRLYTPRLRSKVQMSEVGQTQKSGCLAGSSALPLTHRTLSPGSVRSESAVYCLQKVEKSNNLKKSRESRSLDFSAAAVAFQLHYCGSVIDFRWSDMVPYVAALHFRPIHPNIPLARTRWNIHIPSK